MDEAINFKITAQNDAIPSFKKTSAELQNVQVDIKKVGDQTAKSSDAIQKFANVIGAGWLGDAAAGMKELSESVGQGSASLKGGGASALAMKAGLVGLVAYGSTKVGTMIADWVYETKRFKDEMAEAISKARELGDIQSKQQGRRVDKEIADIKEFGGSFENQMSKAKELASQIAREISGKSGQEELAKAQLEKLESQRSFYIASQEEVDSAKANLEIIQQQKKALADRLNLVQQEFSEAELQRQKRREGIEQEKVREAERVNYIVKQEEERKRAIEARMKFEQQEQEKLFKMREKAAKKQQDAEIKMAGESVKSLEKQISELDKMKTSSTAGMSLSSADERMTSLARGSGNIEQQQLEQAKKQTQLMELNKKLMEELARLAKLQADKEEKVFELAGA